MVTYHQYARGHRKTKIYKNSTSRLRGCPFRYATCVHVGIVKPKKPNSANRSITKVNLGHERFLIAYIPGFGHEIKKNYQVMVRGGRVRDLPGVHYRLVRGKRDFTHVETQERFQRRSKYGIRNHDRLRKIYKRHIKGLKRQQEREVLTKKEQKENDAPEADVIKVLISTMNNTFTHYGIICSSS